MKTLYINCVLQILYNSVTTLLFEMTCCPLISPIDHEIRNIVWNGINVRNNICINWIFYYCNICNKHNADYGAQKQRRECKYGTMCTHADINLYVYKQNNHFHMIRRKLFVKCSSCKNHTWCLFFHYLLISNYQIFALP